MPISEQTALTTRTTMFWMSRPDPHVDPEVRSEVKSTRSRWKPWKRTTQTLVIEAQLIDNLRCYPFGSITAHVLWTMFHVHWASESYWAQWGKRKLMQTIPRRQMTPLMGDTGSRIPYWLSWIFPGMILQFGTLSVSFLSPSLSITASARINGSVEVLTFSCTFHPPS